MHVHMHTILYLRAPQVPQGAVLCCDMLCCAAHHWKAATNTCKRQATAVASIVSCTHALLTSNVKSATVPKTAHNHPSKAAANCRPQAGPTFVVLHLDGLRIQPQLRHMQVQHRGKCPVCVELCDQGRCGLYGGV